MALIILRLSLGLALGLVTIFRLSQVHLFELPLHLLLAAAATALAPIAIAHDLEFMLLQLEQRLVGGLLGGESFGESYRGISRFFEAREGGFYLLSCGGP